MTSEVELSGPHLGECALWEAKLTSEYGIGEGDLVKHGSNLSPKSIYKSNKVNMKQWRMILND